MAKPFKRDKGRSQDEVQVNPQWEPEVEKEERRGSVWQEVKDEWDGLLVLMVLYTLQGVPMGLAGAVPMLMMEKGVGLSDIGTFSVSSLPFSLKLLWAPVVDAVYVKSFGRRKTWMVPCQILIAIIFCTAPIERWVDDVDITSLTVAFFVLYFLCATQDIAVDGWALTILSEKNVSYASICNSAGQTLGFFISLTGYLALNSYGILNLTQFCVASGVAFFAATVTIAVLKSEVTKDDCDPILKAYKGLWTIVKSNMMWELVKVLMLWKIPFCVSGIAALKVQENGVAKETLALISTCIVPINVLTPIVCAKWTTGSRPFDAAVQAYIPRLLLVVPTVALVVWSSASVDWFFYVCFIAVSVAENVLMTVMFTAQMGFFARVSDSSLGGSYMTVLNTLANIGTLWVLTLALKICDSLAIGSLDGFYVLAAGSTIIGSVWYFTFGRAQIERLSSTSKKDWLLNID